MDAAVRQLYEFEKLYVAFRRVDVVYDVNDGHGFVQELLAWPKANAATRLTVSVDVHPRKNMSHPFQLAWKHRADMAVKIRQYDWFLAAESDTFVPAIAIAAQVAYATTLYEKHGMLLGFVRLCNDSLGRSFYSDITKPAARGAASTLPGIGSVVSPTNTYASVWAYPQTIMHAFVRSDDWKPVLKTSRNMRERAAWGWRTHGRIVTLVEDAPLRIYHLGKSGPFYARVRGHCTLPAGKLLS